MSINHEELVSKIRTILDQLEEKPACLLLHPETIAILAESPYFDKEMTNLEHNVRGHIWGVAVREDPVYRPNQIGYEGRPHRLEETVATPVEPWWKQIEDSSAVDHVDRKVKVLMRRINDLMSWKLFEKCDEELKQIDLDKITHDGLLVSLLVITRMRGTQLAYRPELVQKVEARLLELYDGDQERVDKTIFRHREPEDKATVSEFVQGLSQGKLLW